MIWSVGDVCLVSSLSILLLVLIDCGLRRTAGVAIIMYCKSISAGFRLQSSLTKISNFYGGS
jgi:hypothetical protein